jgi:hypothetical protein
MEKFLQQMEERGITGNNRQGGDVMKKLALSALFLMLLFGSAVGHNGSLGLFAGPELNSCSAPIGNFGIDTVMMYYIRDAGPDLGKALQFRLDISTIEALPMGYEWNSQIVLELGSLTGGISITASQCLGGDQPSVYIGSIFMMNMGAQDLRFTVIVMEDPTAAPPGIYITECAVGEPMWTVLGGTFVFNGECSTGVEETSWGAIKELYR